MLFCVVMWKRPNVSIYHNIQYCEWGKFSMNLRSLYLPENLIFGLMWLKKTGEINCNFINAPSLFGSATIKASSVCAPNRSDLDLVQLTSVHWSQKEQADPFLDANKQASRAKCGYLEVPTARYGLIPPR